MKRSLITLMAGAVLVLAMSSCSKDRECKCSFDEPREEDSNYNVFIVDGVDCEGIKEMAFEQVVPADGGGTTLERYDVRKVTCRSHGA